MAALPLAVILALAIDPRCGAAAPGSEFAQRLRAIAISESGGDPYAIHINGPGGGARYFLTVAEAIAAAKMLDVSGRDYDAGLLGINRRQFARHGLTVETAFQRCASMKAGADHYAADVSASAIWTRAHMRYNTGSLERGAAYAASVEQVLARVRDVQPAAPADDVRTPEPPRPPSGLEDALHPGPPAEDADDGMGDALHHSNPKDEPQ